MAASSYKKLTVGTGDTLRSVSLSAGRPSGVNVCVCDSIFGFLITAAGARRLDDSLFPRDNFFSAAVEAPSFCCKLESDPDLDPRAKRSPGGGIPILTNQTNVFRFNKITVLSMFYR